MSQQDPTLVETVMSTIFAPSVQERIRALRENHQRNVAKFETMNDAQLAENAAYYHRQSARPNFEEGSPVYDVVLHDVIVPEMIRRLRDSGGGK